MRPHDLNPAVVERPGRPPLPDVADRHWAWFLDVDGTLLEIERHPDMVTADRGLLRLLNKLSRACDGAVALISGRSLEQLEDIFNPLALAAGASHGLEMRLPDGGVRHLGQTIPARTAAAIASFASQHEGLLLEQKPLSISLHYRERPDLEKQVIETLKNIHAEMDNGFRLLRGKMVVELTPAAADKGSAIKAFMDIAPFSGRRPVFVGDDVTDEDGFVMVNDLGGLSVRIGDTDVTAARWRFADISEFRKWLRGALKLL